MLRINKWCWTICSTVKFVWLTFESGWFQRWSSSYSAGVKSFETSRQTWLFSFWDGILSINSYHMQCEHEKTFTGIHVFLLVHFCYETTSVCIKLISVYVESTKDVYQNRLPSKQAYTFQIQKEVKPWSQGWIIAAGAYPGFCSMKLLEEFLLPLDGMLVHRRSLPCKFVRFPPTNSRYPFIHLGGERHCESKVSCPRTQHRRLRSLAH